MIRHSLVFLALCFSTHAAAELQPRATDSVLSLTKNTNSNQVHYGVHVDEQCRPLKKMPAYAYWRMLEKGPDERAKIMFWEQPGYGVEQPDAVHQSTNAGQFLLMIRGLPERPIELHTMSSEGECGALGFTTIANQRAQIERIDIEVSGWANVHRIEIHGLSTRDGQPLSEVVHQDQDSPQAPTIDIAR
jgi:Domain of unknown function (DUF4833)